MASRYKIISINAYSLFWNTRNQFSGTDEEPVFQFTDEPGKTSYILRSDNALFYQILQVTGEKAESEDALRKSILFIDFSSVFRNIKPESVISKINGDKSDCSDESLLALLLDPDRGINVDFGNGDVRCFVPFDKSGSMARTCRMSYILKDIRDTLNERLQLGIDFGPIKMRLSKYYAYRGLYLTTAKRIEPDDDYAFDEKTVIVIPDLPVYPGSDFVNGDPQRLKVNKYDGDTAYRFKTISNKIEANAFDGEGIISTAYADFINSRLSRHPGEKATSFQIRMPFIKGMLHQVAFTKYFYMEGSTEGEVIVNDVFGIPRKIGDAQIILTKSMFKCFGWLRDYWKETRKEPFDIEHDPMKFFFENMRKYDHALYVCSSNLSLQKTEYDRLSYQFLATMKLDSETFDSLISDHFSICDSQIKEKYFYSDEDDADPVVLKAAKRNKAFYAEKRLKDNIRTDILATHEECGKGRLMTAGEHRYLSADLGAFLQYILVLSKKRQNPRARFDYNDKAYKGKLLYDHFYMASPQISVTDGGYAAIFRNPHLSRNEECIMRPADPELTSFYDEYFGHLTGVIMTPVSSLAPLMVGGADFDGDTVKIYTDERIVNAVKDGVYTEAAKNPGTFYRKLPVIDILKVEVDNTRLNDKSFREDFIKVILHTFSSEVGEISNMALQFAESEYGDSDESSRGDELCAQSTLITGLEIDAAKNGGHPTENIERLRNKAKELSAGSKVSRMFISCKNAIKETPRGQCSIDVDKSDQSAYILKYYGNKKDIKIPAPDMGSCNLGLLPYRFAEHRMKKNKFSGINAIIKELTAGTADPVRFTFETVEGWEEGLNAEHREKVLALVKAYGEIMRFIWEFKRTTTKYQKSIALKKLNHILLMKYDSVDGPLPQAGSSVSVNDVCNSFIGFVYDKITTPDEAMAAMQRFRESDWSYTAMEDRRRKVCEILGVSDESEFTDEMACLVCDFSQKGYNILYHALRTVHDNIMAPCTPRDVFKEEKHKAPTDVNSASFEYYLGEFLNVLENSFNVKDDRDEEHDETSSEDYSFDDSEEQESADIPQKALSLLAQIEGRRSWKRLSRSERLDVLKCVYSLAGNKNDLGTFFWTVLPEDLILENIKEDRANA